MTDIKTEYCPKCGKKTFEYSFCMGKLRCSSCGYFLVYAEFKELKRKARKKANAKE